MSIILLLLVFIIFSNASFVSNTQLQENYLDKKQTTTINGIFVFLVFMSHAKQYFNLDGPYNDTYKILSSFLNQAIVVTFLFYSGYGIMESIKRKGPHYVNTFPIKAIKLLLQFDIAVLLFLTTHWLLGNQPPLKNIVLALTTWGSIGNSNWYITAILIFYILVFISFKISKNNWISLILLTILTISVVYFFMKIDRPAYTYNTMICFVFGIGYSLIHEKIEKLLNNNMSFLITLFVTLSIAVYTRPEIYNDINYYSIWMISFMIFILLFSMKVKLDSPILYYFGTQVFSIYILQRIPMMIFSHYGLTKNYLSFFALSFVSTLILAALFDKYITPTIDKAVTGIVGKLKK